MSPQKKSTKARPPGRPQTQHMAKLEATPEEVARALFAGAKPLDPDKRLKRKQ